MPDQPETTIVIRPTSGWLGINVHELWRFRGLLGTFAWRDIKVRYKQAVIGVAWALIQPILLMIVFSVFFGGLAKVPSDGVPYPIFVYSGLLFWNYFSTALTGSSNSLVDNESILKKIYFPRLILPLSPTITPMIDFLIAYVVLAGMLIFYHVTPSWVGLLLLPILMFLSFLSAAGIGSFLAAVNVRFRDVRYALPFFIQTLMFVTPVIYPTTLVPKSLQWLIALNPMTGIIEAARSIIIQTKPINYPLLLVSAGIAIVVFIVGLFYFRRTERVFADVA